jgi:hypothetical protein
MRGIGLVGLEACQIKRGYFLILFYFIFGKGNCLANFKNLGDNVHIVLVWKLRV